MNLEQMYQEVILDHYKTHSTRAFGILSMLRFTTSTLLVATN